MASNETDQQRNVQDVTFNIPMAGNRGRPVARIRIVPFNSQSADQAKAEREEKEKLLRQQQAGKAMEYNIMMIVGVLNFQHF